MAIAISEPNFVGKIGPGYRVTATGFSGPTALDDIFQVSVARHSTGCGICIGTALFAGSTQGRTIVGDTRATNPFATRMLCDVTAGDACDLVVQRFTHGGSFIEGATFTGYVWDPIGGLWVLPALALFSAASGAELDQVLAAVTKTVTNSP